MKVTLCKSCGGNIQYDDEKFIKSNWVIREEKPCDTCKGSMLSVEHIPNNGIEITGTRYSESIFGNMTSEIKLKRKPNVQGFDLWIDKKKLTHGRKYLKADSIENAIAQTLKGNEYRRDLYFEIV